MFLQEQIIRLKRRIKRIEENPSAEHMRSNKLRYEIELQECLHIEEAWKEGKPFGILRAGRILTRPLGFEPEGYIDWGDRVSDPLRYQSIAVNKFGFPDHTCDRTMTALGLFLSGEVPTPRLMVGDRVPCDPERWSMTAAAKYTGALFFELQGGVNLGYDNIHYVAEQLAELIELAEKSVPGIKYEESKLLELMALDQEAQKLLRHSYELRKKVPCPISPQDCFRLMRLPSRDPDPTKTLEYNRIYHDELFERAEKGISGVKEEKLRIAWLATGPYGRGTFDLLNQKGIAMPWFHYGAASYNFGVVRNDYFDDKVYGRKLTPLEETVRQWNSNTWAGNAAPWVNTLIDTCRDLKIDAVVDFLQVGCIPTKNLKRITAQRLKEELGIPTLDLEGREHFMTDEDRVNMNKRLEEFLDMCVAQKK